MANACFTSAFYNVPTLPLTWLNSPNALGELGQFYVVRNRLPTTLFDVGWTWYSGYMYVIGVCMLQDS